MVREMATIPATEEEGRIPDLMETFPIRADQVAYDGYVKLRLVHAKGITLTLPDVLVIDLDGWRWFAPQYFSACLLSFVDGAGYGQFDIEPKQGVKLLIGITRDRFVCSYPDGSFLYRCRVAASPGLKAQATGTCTIEADHKIWLNLFHHTSGKVGAAIRKSGHFRGSSWNIQGNKQLANVEYVYFASLPKITSRKHLYRIAMASDGMLDLITTNGVPPQDVVRIDVYRESTLNRRHAIKVRVPADSIAPQHVWRHDPIGQPIYYEVSHPAILRVGIEPRTVLPFDGVAVDPASATLKRFDYVVLGYANSKAGLIAPYNEEETREVFKIERCEAEGDLFAYWRAHANTDQFSKKTVEWQTFQR